MDANNRQKVVNNHNHLLNKNREQVRALARPDNVVLLLNVRDAEAAAVADRIHPGTSLMLKRSVELTAIPTMITDVTPAEATSYFPKLAAEIAAPAGRGFRVLVADSGEAELLVIAFD